LLIHIGYHKTATTWLQKYLFRPSMGFGVPVENKPLYEKLIFPHSFVFDGPACKGSFQPLIDRVSDGGLVPVISLERLSGSPHSGGHDSKLLADRLREVFGDVRILIVIREQKSMILSTYKQYVRSGGANSLAKYLKPTRHGRSRLPLFDLDYFQYHHLIHYYRELFGTSNVLVLTFEQFRDDPKAFVLEIGRFSGAFTDLNQMNGLSFQNAEYPSLSGFSIAVKRRLNLLFADDRICPWSLFPNSKWEKGQLEFLTKMDSHLPAILSRRLDEKLKEKIAKVVQERYQMSNHITAGMMNLDLRRWGYDLK
jgi:hypothetical protein